MNQLEQKVDLKILEEINRFEALKQAFAIVMRDHFRHSSCKGHGTIEIRLTYEDGNPIFLEDMGREKHTFKDTYKFPAKRG